MKVASFIKKKKKDEVMLEVSLITLYLKTYFVNTWISICH